MVKIYCFDIDDTLCTTTGTDYANAIPKWDRIAKINHLFDQGNTIKLLTARGSKTKIDWSTVTREQLGNWGVKYHELHFGKPFADFYIDDKAISDVDFDWVMNS
jgi:hypothetical protein